MSEQKKKSGWHLSSLTFANWRKKTIEKRSFKGAQKARDNEWQDDKVFAVLSGVEFADTEASILAINGDRGSGKTITTRTIVESYNPRVKNFFFSILLFFIGVLSLGLVIFNGNFRHLWKLSHQVYININIWKILSMKNLSLDDLETNKEGVENKVADTEASSKISKEVKATLWRVVLYRMGFLKHVESNFLRTADQGSIDTKISYIFSKFRFSLFIFFQLIIIGALVAIGIWKDSEIVTSIAAVVEVIMSSYAYFSYENKLSGDFEKEISGGLSNEIITQILRKKSKRRIINIHFEDLDRIESETTMHETLKAIGILYKSKNINIFVETNTNIIKVVENLTMSSSNKIHNVSEKEEVWKLLPKRLEISSRDSHGFERHLSKEVPYQLRPIVSDNLIKIVDEVNELSWRFKERDDEVIDGYKWVYKLNLEKIDKDILFSNIFKSKISRNYEKLEGNKTTKGEFWYIPNTYNLQYNQRTNKLGINDLINGKYSIVSHSIVVSEHYVTWAFANIYNSKIIGAILDNTEWDNKELFVSSKTPVHWLEVSEVRINIANWAGEKIFTKVEKVEGQEQDHDAENIRLNNAYLPMLKLMATINIDFFDQLNEDYLPIAAKKILVSTNDYSKIKSDVFNVLMIDSEIGDINISAIKTLEKAKILFDWFKTKKVNYVLNPLIELQQRFDLFKPDFLADAISKRVGDKISNNKDILNNIKRIGDAFWVEVVNSIENSDEDWRDDIQTYIEEYIGRSDVVVNEWFNDSIKIKAFLERDNYVVPESVFDRNVHELGMEQMTKKYLNISSDEKFNSLIQKYWPIISEQPAVFIDQIIRVNKEESFEIKTEETYIWLNDANYHPKGLTIDELTEELNIASKYKAVDNIRRIKRARTNLKARTTREKHRKDNEKLRKLEELAGVE